MQFSPFLIGALVLVVSAHSGQRDGSAAMPKLLGAREFLSESKGRNALLKPLKSSINLHPQARKVLPSSLEERQNVNGQCGAGLGSCATGVCCSPAGWCGTGIDYCASPDCQYQYGPACDANIMPAGASTASIARPQLGSIPYGGAGIYDCLVPGEIAFTFDDGPYLYTNDLLNKLAVYNAKATFMITGNNLGKGSIDTNATWTNVIKRMVAEGHQIASHTWSHQNLDEVDAATFQKQMIYNEMAFRNILGYFPTYMRPPYSACATAQCMNGLKTLGYHVTYFDLDTEGYLNDSPTLIQNSKNIWDQTINPSNPATDNYIEIEHDIHYQTVYNLTDYILASMYKKGYKSVTVGQCLGDPAANWYRSAGGTTSTTTAKPSTTSSKAPTSTPKQVISTDGSCSATITCQGSTFGNCCSQHSYCGSTTDYCGTGCNPAAGSCGTQVSSSATKPATTSIVKSTTSSTKTSTSAKPSASLKVSGDGTCGITSAGVVTGQTCAASTFGVCCSQYGWCGGSASSLTATYCGTGCQKGFGTCS